MATHIIDKSAWIRLGDPAVPAHWPAALVAGGLAITGIVMIEILVGSRTSAQFTSDRIDLDAMPRRSINDRVIERALDVQSLMVRAGTHRAPSPADFLVAACAELNGLAVLHYDKDFDLIAAVTGQACDWLAPAGALS